MRQIKPELSQLVERIGWKKAAKRFNRTVGTIKQWVRKGVPLKNVKEVLQRWIWSERSKRARQIYLAHKETGVTRIKTLKQIDTILGLEEGKTQERFHDRKIYWFDQKGIEVANPKEFYQERDGKVLMVDVEGVVWRAYTVEDKLFWTQATYLEGYATAQEFVEMYESLSGYIVRISFPL